MHNEVIRSIHRRFVTGACLPMLIAILLPVAETSAESPCGSVISEDTTLTDDYVQTGHGNCFTITSSGKTLNLNNKRIICRNTTDGVCLGSAVIATATGTTIKNGRIVSDGGDWLVGVNCAGFFTTYPCSVQDIFVENALDWGILGAKLVQNSVINNAGICIDSNTTLPNGSSSARYFENFCDGIDAGIIAQGPTSGTAFNIERNFVRTSGTAADGILLESGNFTIQKNIVQADDPMDDGSAGTVTYTKNICDDLGPCPLPTNEPFSLFNLDFIQ